MIGSGTGLLIAAAVVAWHLQADPQPVATETPYEEIPRPEYEAWMQELGYSE